ncbi:hypothetical protein Sste5346_009103 [Sporothrix stenoceras]|uniref:Uncharacterized protein n=1 Tax=Sporothrix stenoceras TaxID=5173 RepID=A0ABR3YLZ2_9PEZI
MRTARHHQASTLFFFTSPLTLSFAIVSASVIRGVDVARSSSFSAPPLSKKDGLPVPLTNPAYLPAQIGGIVGSYAFCLVVVAVSLLLLSKRRREHLQSGEEFDFAQPTHVDAIEFPETLQLQDSIVPFAVKSPTFFGGNPNFSYPGSAYAGSPISPTETHGGTIVSSLHAKGNLYLSASYASSFRVPGVDPSVDQEIVTADRDMAQSQLEEMYKYVMEQEEAKANGVVLEGPPAPLSPQSGSNSSRSSPIVANPGANVGFNNPSPATTTMLYNLPAANHRKDESMGSTSMLLKKEKTKSKPLSLNLSKDKEKDRDGGERTSRTSSILSALKSPRNKKKMQGISISSPIMTPMSGTFPRFGTAGGGAPGYGYGNGGGYAEAEEMNTIPPRHYAPAAPPPVPTLQQPVPPKTVAIQQQPTPETSPLSTLSIDERIGAAVTINKNQQLPPVNTNTRHNRNLSLTTGTPIDQRDPESAVSAMSTVSNNSGDSSAPLVGLPTSPKPGVNRFPSLSSLPASPRATKTTFFNNGNQPLSPTGVAFASASPVSTTSGLGRSNAPSALRTGGGLPLRAYEPSITSPSFATHNQTKQTVFERAQPLSPGFNNGSQTPWTGAPVPYSPYQPFSPVVPMTPSLVTKADRKRMRRLEPKTPTMEMVRSSEDIW